MAFSSERERILKYHAALKRWRERWDPEWKLLDDHIAPRHTRFRASERTGGPKRHAEIINSAPRDARDVLGAGMMAGLTSPARPWFRLAPRDPGKAEIGNVRAWLHAVEERLRWAFSKGRWYNALSVLYPDLATFGTQVLWMEPDEKKIIHCEISPIGEFCLGVDARGQVATISREVAYTVEAMLEKFGREAVSQRVRDAYDRGNYLDLFEVIHLVEPNRDRDPAKADARGMPWASFWLEKDDAAGGFLKKGGFQEFPAMCPRWEVLATDVYGDSPGLKTLCDCKLLQATEKEKFRLIQQSSTPPMNAPTSARQTPLSALPGALNFVDGPAGQTFTPAIQVSAAAIAETRLSIQEITPRIFRAFKADLWRLISDNETRVTAEEIRAKLEEKNYQLGPALEGLQHELLSPGIERAFGILGHFNLIPPPPRELLPDDVEIEYVSPLAQSQKLVGVAANDRLLTLGANAAQVWGPEALDKINIDELIDDQSDRLGVTPGLVRTDEEVAKMRAARAQAQQQQAMMQNALALSQGAKTLSQTNLESDNALNRMLNGPLAAVGGAA